MQFRIHHRTHYRYAGAASESFMEVRLRPMTNARQTLLSHRLESDPSCNLHAYTDYFGNHVQTFSLVHRHTELVLDSYAEVETHAAPPPEVALELSVSEARQLYRAEPLRFFEFLNPSPAIQFSAAVNKLANRFFRPGNDIGPSILALNHWIYTNLRYVTGSTRIDTTVDEVLTQKKGVCQDFAQAMIAVLRSAEIPARYLVGYIETDAQRDAGQTEAAAKTPSKRRPLIGAAESHAWVEVCLPGGHWWALDPTNDCVAGERHVQVAAGRDYHDCTPTRGVFKGTHTERLTAAVDMRRLSD
ncbi:transglutaminase family protein [Actomonas aquatica]|uniref:Transglutaminase family protein n=1 Tax=Actomonas aquatica TaxID=2866162 RepID=A0ABZ1C662_9BACT|nr:transglutaminase family protein [Opitutus sp. WL0086]WRQ86855.1 transglutaminase family protein [Opitutus sp. WL0086]